MPWVLAKDEAKKTVWKQFSGTSFRAFRGAELLESFIHPPAKDSGAARKWSCNRKPNPLRKTGSGRSSEKVEELHHRLKKKKEDVIDIEAKPEITFDDLSWSKSEIMPAKK